MAVSDQVGVSATWQPDELLVGERLDPGEAVRVGPDRVVDPAEVDVDLPAAVLEQVRQQDRHLVGATAGTPAATACSFHCSCAARHVRPVRDELVPAVRAGAPERADAAGEHVEEEQGAGDLPATEVAGGRRAPHMCGQPATRGRDDLRQLLDLLGRDLRLGGGEVEGVGGVVLGQPVQEHREVVGRVVRVQGGHVGRPVHPAADVRLVDLPRAQQVGRDRQQDRRLAARPRREPQVGVRSGVRHPRVEDDELCAAADLALHDPLGVRVEVVPGLQMAGQQQDHLGVGVVRRRPVVAAPQRVAEPGAGGADVGVAVVPVDAPGLQEPLGEAVLPGAAHVVDHLVAAVLDDRGPDPRGDVVERLIPGDRLPLPAAPLADPAQRVQDPVRVGELVDRRRPLRTVAPPRPRVRRVALQLADRQVALVDVGQQPARRLAVEAGRRDEHVLPRHLARVRLRVELHVGVPRLRRREVAPAPSGCGHRAGRHSCATPHDSGTSCPARTNTLS